MCDANTSWGFQIVLCDNNLICDTDKFVSSDHPDVTALVDWA